MICCGARLVWVCWPWSRDVWVKCADDSDRTTRNPIVKATLRNRWPQFVIRVIALAASSSPLSPAYRHPGGNHNFSIVFVWIVWWALLMLIAVPFFGRGWCNICPIPMPGEWLQNGAMLGPAERASASIVNGPALSKHLDAKPRLYAGRFVQCRHPDAAQHHGDCAAGLPLRRTGTSLVFERRAFCRYLCPVGGFIGLYSQSRPSRFA